MQVQLVWRDPSTRDLQESIQETPIALGRYYSGLPGAIEGRRVARIVLVDDRVAEYHALIDVQNDQLTITDRNTPSGTFVNGTRRAASPLEHGDRLQIGPYKMQVRIGIGIVPIAQAQASRRPASSSGQGTPSSRRPSSSSSSRRPSSSSDGMTQTRPRTLAGEVCNKKVGFLFPRRCGRTDPTGCPHCRGKEQSRDPFFLSTERSLYSEYGDYSGNNWGSRYYQGNIRDIDFTEADAASLDRVGTDFEQDMGAS